VENVTCAYCLGPVHADRAPRCSICDSAHHRDCWYENGGCAAFGCAHSPDMMTANASMPQFESATPYPERRLW
jgi:hypothetical protein